MTTPELPADVAARVVADFAAEQRGAILEALRGLGGVTREHARVARCVLFLASGDRAEFERMVALARTDFRDVIVAAEYDDEDLRLRDFSKPFGSNGVA